MLASWSRLGLGLPPDAWLQQAAQRVRQLTLDYLDANRYQLPYAVVHQARADFGDDHAPRSGPLDDGEFAALRDTVQDWETSWAGDTGDALVVVLAYALGIQIRVLQHPGPGPGTGQVAGPAVLAALGQDGSPAVEVYHTGLNHYNGSVPDRGQAPAAEPGTDTQPGLGTDPPGTGAEPGLGTDAESGVQERAAAAGQAAPRTADGDSPPLPDLITAGYLRPLAASAFGNRQIRIIGHGRTEPGEFETSPARPCAARRNRIAPIRVRPGLRRAGTERPELPPRPAMTGPRRLRTPRPSRCRSSAPRDRMGDRAWRGTLRPGRGRQGRPSRWRGCGGWLTPRRPRRPVRWGVPRRAGRRRGRRDRSIAWRWWGIWPGCCSRAGSVRGRSVMMAWPARGAAPAGTWGCRPCCGGRWPAGRSSAPGWGRRGRARPRSW